MSPIVSKTAAVWLIALILSPFTAPLSFVNWAELAQSAALARDSEPRSRTGCASTQLCVALTEALPAVPHAAGWHEQTHTGINTPALLSDPTGVFVASSAMEVNRTAHRAVTPTLRI